MKTRVNVVSLNYLFQTIDLYLDTSDWNKYWHKSKFNNIYHLRIISAWKWVWFEIRPHIQEWGAKRTRCISSKRAACYLIQMQAQHWYCYLVLLLKFEHAIRALRSFKVLLKFIIVVVKVNKAWSSALEKQQWKIRAQNIFLTFPVGFWIPIIFSNSHLN